MFQMSVGREFDEVENYWNEKRATLTANSPVSLKWHKLMRTLNSKSQIILDEKKETPRRELSQWIFMER